MGKHTTTFAEMIEMSQGGYVIDTPGIKGFGVIDIEKNELYHFFPEIFRYSHDCQYQNCSHTHEPNCAVRDAVDKEVISRSRYFSYLSLYNEEDSKHRN
jgi:ribosome biogenesis GTPase